jgi:hypothetical protein
MVSAVKESQRERLDGTGLVACTGSSRPWPRVCQPRLAVLVRAVGRDLPEPPARNASAARDGLAERRGRGREERVEHAELGALHVHLEDVDARVAEEVHDGGEAEEGGGNRVRPFRTRILMVFLSADFKNPGPARAGLHMNQVDGFTSRSVKLSESSANSDSRTPGSSCHDDYQIPTVLGDGRAPGCTGRVHNRPE